MKSSPIRKPSLVGMLLLLSTAFLQAQFQVTFQVDMRPAIQWGAFEPATDTVALRGGVAPLSWSSDFFLSDADLDSVFSGTVNFAVSGQLEYKYVTISGGSLTWEGFVGSGTAGNRVHQVMLATETLPPVSFDNLAGLLPPPPYSYEPDLNTALLMHFEEGGSSVYDASGNGYHGNAIGTGTTSGYFGAARAFGGGDVIVSSEFINTSSSNFTFEAWFNTTAGGTLISKAPPSAPWAQGGKTLYIVGGRVIFDVGWVGDLQSPGNNYSDGQWHHAAVSVELEYLGGSSDQVTMYIDGEQVAQRNDWDINQFSDAGMVIKIGETTTDFAGNFTGTIDEVRISDAARTPVEFNLQTPPQNLSSAPMGASIDLLWAAGGGGSPFKEYRIYRGISPASISLLVGTTSTESFSDASVAAGLTYYYEVSAVDSADHESRRSNTTSTTFGTPADFERFEVVANATGTLAQPDMAAFAFNNNGFPTLDGLAPDGVNDRPSATQQTNGTRWGVHYYMAAGNDGTYDNFKTGVTRNGRNWARIYPYDFEIRFTPGTHYAFDPWSGANVVLTVPFEIWNIGQNTPDDTTDDYQMFPYVTDGNGNGVFDFSGADHSVSGGTNDPELDAINFATPTNTTPGSAGYQEAVDSILADPTGHVRFASDGLGGGAFSRLVLLIWNGGDVNDPAFPTNVAASMPEQGTVFRIRTTLDPAPATSITLSRDYAASDAQFSETLVSDGYPDPAFALVSGPPGVLINGDNLTWTPTVNDWGWQDVVIDATNASGTLTDTVSIFVEPFRQASNQVQLDVSNRGKVGAFGQYGKGFFFNGQNAVYTADFGLVDKNDSLFAGGLYTTGNSFSGQELFTDEPSRFPGFSSFRTSYTDAWEPSPIGVRVFQRTHWSMMSPDDRYVIMEYSIVNESGASIDSLFAQITTDPDIGDYLNNNGNYDPAYNLVYAYEEGGANNGAYYGVTLISHQPSGYATWNGPDADYVRNVNSVTAMVPMPSGPSEIRNQLSTGPFTLNPLDTVTVVFAYVAGNNETEVRASASSARSMWNEAQGVNIASVQFDGSGDRVRVLDGNPIQAGADPSVFQMTGNVMSVEAWVYPMALPGANSGYNIVNRPSNNGFNDPYYTFALKLDNYGGAGPQFVFAVTDGVNPFGTGANVVNDPDPVNVGQWYHVVGTWDGSTTRIYVDGNLKAINTFPLTMGTGSVGLYVGGTIADYFNGLIDEVRLWNDERTQTEIQANMNSVLTGNEANLVGYWPLDDAYLAPNGQNATRDKSPYQNDLYVQFDARFVGYPAPNPVQILPSKINAPGYAVANIEYRGGLSADGWPAPTFSLISGPPGMSLSGDTLIWTPLVSDNGPQSVVLNATNTAGTFQDSVTVYVDVLRSAENLVRLDVSNRGVIGTQDRFGKGMFFNGQNGLYRADFSLVDRDDQLFAGGLYGPYPFASTEPFFDIGSPLIGFSAFKTEYTDSLEPNRMGVRIRQETYTKQAVPDDRYIFVSYTITNETAMQMDDIFAQITADFDVGNAGNNLGGYEADLGLNYAYEQGGGTNSNYYGFLPVDAPVSGYATWSDNDAAYVRSVSNLTNMVAAPTTPADTRSQITVGPFSLPPAGSYTVTFAYVAGSDLGTLRTAAEAAKQTWNDPEVRSPLPVFTEFESNNSTGLADLVSLGTRLEGTIDTTNDVDYFEFSIAVQETVQVVGMQGAGSNLQYRFEIYNSAGTMQYNSAWYYYTDGIPPYMARVLNPDTYYLRVLRRDNNTTSFPTKTRPATDPETEKLQMQFLDRVRTLGTAASRDTGSYAIILRTFEPVIGKPGTPSKQLVTDKLGVVYFLYSPGDPVSQVEIEYGPTQAYGQTIPVSSNLSATGLYGASQSIESLAPETQYHARLKITNPVGVSYSTDLAFTTSSPSSTWRHQLVSSNYYTDAHIRNASTIYVAGEAIRASYDGGLTWADRSAYFSYYHNSQELAFLGTGEFISAGYGTEPIVYTADSGQTWIPIFSDGFFWNFQTIATPDGLSIVAGGYSNNLIYSLDGAATWFAATHDNGVVTFYDVEYFGTSTVVAGGQGGTIRSTDGGATWSATSNAMTSVYEIQSLDNVNGYAASWNGIYVTSDGGATWTKANVDPQLSTARSIHMLDLQEGYAAMNDGRILHTSDGWATFSDEGSGVQAQVNDITASGGLALAVGQNGLILMKGSTQEAEPNNTAPTANPLAYNSDIDAVIDPDTDPDYFSFTAAAGDTVKAETRTLPSSGLNTSGTFVRIYDDLGNQYGSYFYEASADFGARDKVVAVLPNDGTYYVKITSPFDGGQPFPNKTIGGGKLPEPLGPGDGYQDAPPKAKTLAPDWNYSLNLARGGSEPPDVKTLTPLAIYTNDAVLRGGVMPNGGNASVDIEYGTTTAFGTSMTVDGMPVSGTDFIAFRTSLTGLQASTTYYYRFVATSEFGVSSTIDTASFTTPPAPDLWVKKPTNTETRLRAVSFSSDQQLGIVVGEAGFGLATTDRGVSWIPMNLNTPVRLRDVHVFDASTAVVVGNSDVIRRTVDGGLSWSTIPSPVPGTTWYDVSFIDSQNGFASGSAGAMMKTTDGGQTWTAVTSVSATTFAIQMLDLNTIVGGTWSGTFFTSIDGGTTWAEDTIDAVNLPWVLGVAFFDSQNGLLGDINGNVYTTNDGGTTWSGPSSISGGAWLFRAIITDSVSVSMAGSDGFVYQTSDRGMTWTSSSTGSSNSLFGLTSPAKDVLYAVGNFGDFFERDTRTIDVTFNVDMRPAIGHGKFKPSSDSLVIRGSLAPLDWGSNAFQVTDNGDSTYSVTVNFVSTGNLDYKLVILHRGDQYWEGQGLPLSGNRNLFVQGGSQVVGLSFDDLAPYVPSLGEYAVDGTTTALYHLDEDPGVHVHYLGNQVMFDHGPVGYHGVNMGTTQDFGHIASGRFFDGVGGFIDLRSEPISTASTQSFTVEAWIYMNVYPGPFAADVFSQGGLPNTFLGIRPTGYLSAGIRRASDGTMALDSSAQTVPLNSWVHVAMVYDAANKTLDGYMNGAQQFSIALGPSFDFAPSSNSGAFIGAGRTGIGDTAYFFNGWIDELRISSRVVPNTDFNLRLSPPGLAAAASSNAVTLSWFSSGGTSPLRTYRIYKGTTSGNLSVIDSVSTPGYTDGNVVPGATYYYQVTAVDQLDFESRHSIEVSASPLPPPSVVSTVPNRNTTNVPRILNPRIRFNTALDTATVRTNAFVVYSDIRGTISLDSVTYDATNIEVKLFPSTDFLPGERITVLMKRVVTNTNGDLIAKPVILPFVAATSDGNGAFSETQSVGLPAAASDIAVADFDGDGDLDAVVAIPTGTPGLRILDNNGQGSFSISTFTIGSRPEKLVAADFNLDGLPDLAVADNGTSSLFIRYLKGNGDLTFTQVATRSLTATTDALHAGDWDGDGDPDLAISSVAGSYVGILNNTYPTTGFGFSTVGVANPGGMEIVDIEPDGDLDIFFLNSAGGTFRALRNDGFGGYVGVTNFGGPFETGAAQFATGDLNADGKPEVVVSEPIASQIAVHQNNGGLAFNRLAGFAVSQSPGPLTMGDVDGDGDLDIVAGASTTDSVIVVLNNGSLALSQQTSSYATNIPLDLALADVDADGDLDLLVLSGTSVRVLKNNFDTVPPAAPANVAYTAGSGFVSLTWDANGEADFVRYRLFRGTAPNPTTQIDSIEAGTQSYTDTGVSDSVVYFYRLTALDASKNQSGYSTGIAAVPHAPANGEYTVDASTVFLLNFAESAGTSIVDEGSNNNVGTTAGTTVVPGHIGSGRSFSAGESITFTDNGNLNPGTSDFTIEAWFKSSTTAQQRFILKRSGTGYELAVFTDGVPYMDLSDGTTTQGVSATTSVTDGIWHHIAGVREGSVFRTYVDGVKEGEVTNASMGAPDAAADLVIGDMTGTTLDGVRFSSVARTPAEFNLQLPPAGLAANVSGTTINLSWSNGGGSSSLAQYVIYRGTDSTTVAAVDSTTSTSYSDVDLSPSTQYFYRVTAVDSTGFESGRSYAAQATTATPVQANVTTFAGDGNVDFIDSTGTNASFNGPGHIAQDSDGNLYVADIYNHAIRKITPAGVVTTLAGNGTAGTADGIGSAAQFNSPYGIVVGTDGNIYVSEFDNHVIRKVTPQGQTSVFAGSMGATGTADGTGASARFDNPAGLAIDASGNIYVADYFNNKIRMVSPTGLVTTVAGSGTAGFVNGSVGAAQFNGPVAVAIDGNGDLYVAEEQNNQIRKITGGATVSTFAGDTASGWVDGTGTAARFDQPAGISFDPLGNLYVADYQNNVIRKITSAGVVVTVAGDTAFGYVDGLSSVARFDLPLGMLAEGTGILFVGEDGNSVVRRIILNDAPSAYSTDVTSVASTTATINGIVIPNGISTNAYFEYGTDTQYGTTTTTQSAGIGTTGLELSASLTGLTPNVTYHYRVVATNTSGTTFGIDKTFATSLPAPVATTTVLPDSAATDVSVSPTLSWNASTNATTYRLQVATDNAFSSVVLEDSTLTGTSVQIGPLLNDTDYYWHVQGENVTGVSGYTNTWFFHTIVDTPDVPVLVGPTDAATDQAVDITFTWNTAARATSYRLQVSPNSAFSVITYEDSTLTDTSVALTGVLANATTYYWRISAKNAGGTSDFAGARSFTTIIQAPTDPTLATPANGAADQPTSLTLEWNPSSRAATYHLQVAKDTAFTRFVFEDSTLTGTTQSFTGLGNDSTYYWRVRAKNTGGTTAFTSYYAFTTIVAAPDAPIALLPDSASTGQQTTLALTWGTASRATAYQVQVSTSSSFSFLLVNDSTITDTSYTAGPLANDQTYYWKVRALNAGGSSAYTNDWSFTTAVAIADVPVLSSPSDSANDQPATLSLSWGASARATSYRVEVATDSGFTTVVFVDSTVTGTSKGVGPLAYSTKFYWRVRAQNAGGNSDYSAYRMFTTITAPPPTPVLVSPDSNATGVEVSAPLTWNAAERATTYRLQVSLNSNFSITLVDRNDLTDTTFTVGPLQNDSTYYWRVSATGAGGTSAFSNGWSFRTKVAVPPTVTLGSPNDNATGVAINPTLSWNAAARATSYRLEISTSSSFAALTFVDSTLTATSQQVTLSYDTKYYWRVRGENAGGAGAYSVTRNFTTIIEKPTMPVLLAPDSGIVNQPLTLTVTWNSAARAATYRLQVSEISSFTTTVVDVNTLTDTTTTIGPLQYSKTYFWRVSATNAGGTSAFSNRWYFETQPQPPATPTLLTPADFASNLDVNIQFAWNAAARAAEYRLQISKNPSFGSPQVDSSGLTITSATIRGLDHSATYYWRVQASNAGGPSAFSTARQFTTVIAPPAAPTLVAPANNATDVLQGTTFSWNSATTATRYHLQVSTNNGFTALVENDSTLTGTSKEVSTLTYSAQHFWRVRAKNAGGAGAWSVVRTFTAIPPLPIAAVSVTSIDYGSIEAGIATDDKTVTLSNNGGQNLNVSGVSLTGANPGQFSIQSGGGAFSVAAGATRDITVRFAPTSTGQKNATLSLATNDTVNHSNGIVTVSLSGFGTDNTPPYNPSLSVSVSPDTWTNVDDFTISWTPSISDVSGVPNVYYTFDQAPTSGSPGQSVALNGGDSFDVEAPQQGITQVFFYFEDGAGNKNPAQRYSVAVQFDSTKPTIQHDALLVPEVTITNGTPSPAITIDATVDDFGGSGIAQSRVEYRRTQDASFQSASLPAVTIPASLFTDANGDPSGVDYRIVATDGAGNMASTKVFSISVRKVDPPKDKPDPAPKATGTQPTELVKSYRIFSIPYDLDDKKPSTHFQPSFGDHRQDGKDYINWRLQRYTNQTTKQDYENFKSQDALTPGAGFFLIVRGSSNQFTVQSGVTAVNAQKMNDVGIPVQAGWNLVGTPLNRALDTSQLRVTAGVIEDWADYTGTGPTNGWVKKPSQMQPWKGWAIKVSQNANLLFRTIGDQPGEVSPAQPMARLNVMSTVAKNKNGEDWTMSVDAVRADNGMMDIDNRIGMVKGAATGPDAFDSYQPPFIGSGSVALYFTSESEAFMEDIRPVSAEGDVWPMRVKTGDEGAKVTLTFDGADNFKDPAYKVFLIDIDQKMAYDLRKVSEVSINSGSGIRNMQIVAGTKAFVTANNAGVDLYPKEFVLYNNYPNPFNPETIIRYTVSDASDAVSISLKVFDVLGRDVATLVQAVQTPGYYEVPFNAASLSSGTYFYRLQIIDLEGQPVFSQVHRMMLMK